MRDLPDELGKEPFSSASAAASGITRSMLRHRPVRRVFRDVYVSADLEDTLALRSAAARLVIPSRGVACGLTAAWLHNADVLRLDDLDLHVGFAKGRRVRSREGVRVRQETLDPADIVVIDGVAVTTVVRTVFDCLRWLRDPEGLVVADALTHHAQTTVPELHAYFAGQHRLRNLRRGAVLVDDIEPNADSPQETRLRIMLVRWGVGRPTAPVYAFAGGHNFVGKLDMGFETLRLGIEYDGALHWEQRMADERRRRQVREAGWEVLVFGADDLRNPGRLVTEVWSAIRRRRRELNLPPTRPPSP